MKITNFISVLAILTFSMGLHPADPPTVSDIPASIKTITELSSKYKLTAPEVKKFAELAQALGHKDNFANLNSDQAAAYKAAIEMAQYGMIFETTVSDSSWSNPDASIKNKDEKTQTLDSWTSFSTNLSNLSGSKIGEKPTGDDFSQWVSHIADEIGRHETISIEDITKLIGEEKLMPISGESGIIEKITELVTRRMEAPLTVLKTTGGIALSLFVEPEASSGGATAPPTGYEKLKASPKDPDDAKVCFVEALEDPSQSWSDLRSLIQEARRIIYLEKNKISKAEKNKLGNILFGLEKKISDPITTDERINALTKLVESGALNGSVASSDKLFEVRLAKLIDSVSSQASDAQKKAVVDLIDKFAIVGQTDKSKFKDYIRILTEGRHPSELFSSEQMVAFLWDEQDGTEPKQKFMKADLTAGSEGVTFSDNDILHENSQFKLLTTDEAEVIIYLESGNTQYILTGDGSLLAGNPADAAKRTDPNFDNQKFYVYGSKEAFSLKNKASQGFLTVDYEKGLYSEKPGKMKPDGTLEPGKPAGKTKEDGTLEPGAWGIFKIVNVSPLHQDLVKVRKGDGGQWGWRGADSANPKNWSADRISTESATKSLAESIINKYKGMVAEVDSSGEDTDFNADLIIREVSNFFKAAFRVNPEQWDWFNSSGLKDKAAGLVTMIGSSMKEAVTSGGESKKSFAKLKQQIESPPQETLDPHEDAPENGQVVALYVEEVVDGKTKEKFMRVVQETDAQGSHSYLKADETDPVDSRCHLQVVAQGNKLGFSFKAPDGSMQTLQHISRSESDLRRYWNDATGKNAIKRMSRLEFAAPGQGDFNSKERIVEQFQMSYFNKETKTLEYILNSMADGAGIMMIDNGPDGDTTAGNDEENEGYAVAVRPNFTDKKLEPTSKATTHGSFKIKILPISGFVTELGKLRSEPNVKTALEGYTSKIDIVETNQDIEFLIMEFEDFIASKQTNRDDWLNLAKDKKFLEGVYGFIEKIKPRTTGQTDLVEALKNMKSTFAQTDEGELFYKNKAGNKVATTMAIKWTSPEGEDLYLSRDASGKVSFSSDGYNDPSTHFTFDWDDNSEIADPLKFNVKIKQSQ